MAAVALAGCAGPGEAAPIPSASPQVEAFAATAEMPTSAPRSPTAEPEPAPSTAPTEPTREAPAEPGLTAAPAEPPRLPSPTFDPDTWRDLPVIPEIGEGTRAIYQRGLELGNNPRAFSKIGDCGSTPAWFLGDFDRGPAHYRLGEHTYLEPVIEYYQGSFDRTSLGAKSGFNASSVFAPIWSNTEQCEPAEGPLACEYRVHNPMIAFIMLGTNDVYHPDKFEPQMRAIIEYSIEQGVIPILSTKADDEEGDGSLNATIARLAHEYDVPLWNYWRAVQPLPNGGLQADGVHLTWAGNRFDDPQAMKSAWPVRNLTALQTLDAVWRFLNAEPAP